MYCLQLKSYSFRKFNYPPYNYYSILGTTCVNASFSRQLKDWLKGNWSYSTAFYPGESRFASIYENRVKEAMGLLPENGGKFQITSYPKGIGRCMLYKFLYLSYDMRFLTMWYVRLAKPQISLIRAIARCLSY